MAATFLIAAPLGVAMGFAGMTLLPADMSERLFAAFLVLIVLGALGIALFALPPKKEQSSPQATADIPLGSNVIRFDRKHRPGTVRPTLATAARSHASRGAR